jgi:hypothetical protein
MDMNDTVQTEILTLEDLQRQKAEALEELRAQKQVMNDTARNLFAPIAPAANKETAIMRAFNTGMAVFDGAMLGIKLMKKSQKNIQTLKINQAIKELFMQYLFNQFRIYNCPQRIRY